MNCFEKVAQILKNEGIEWISCFPENQIIKTNNSDIPIDVCVTPNKIFKF